MTMSKFRQLQDSGLVEQNYVADVLISVDGEYSVAHSPQVFVLDPDGRLRAEMYDPSVDAMAGVAKALLIESNEWAIDEQD